MQKKVISLLENGTRKLQEDYFLVSSLKTLFFKPILTQFNVQEILPFLKIQSFQPHETIFSEGQKIRDYIFLLEGNILLVRKSNAGITPDSNICFPSIIGEYFYSRSSVREKKAVNGEGISKILNVDKRIFDELNHKMLKQFREVQLFIERQCGDISEHKISIYEEFETINCNLNAKIDIKDSLYIIMKGQCLMSYKENKNKLPLSSKTSENALLLSKKEVKKRKLLILGENQWIYNKGNKKYEYSVVSEKMTMIKVPLKLIPELQEKAQKIHTERIERNKKSIQKIETSDKISKYEAPIIVQKRGKESQNILNSIDSSLNPAILKQKYLLGYSKFKVQNIDKQNNLSISYSRSQIFSRRQRFTADLQPKAKDWSKYLKLPTIRQMSTKNKDKIIIKSLIKSIRD